MSAEQILYGINYTQGLQLITLERGRRGVRFKGEPLPIEERFETIAGWHS